MSGLVRAGVSQSIERSSSDGRPDLFVAAKIYDNSSGTPIFVVLVPMTHVADGTYAGKFNPSAGKDYVVTNSVYTDGTYTTRDTDYGTGSESFYAEAQQQQQQTIASGAFIIRGNVANQEVLTGSAEAVQMITGAVTLQYRLNS